MSTTTTTHIVGLGVRVGTVERQRCAWCGEVLVAEDLANLASPDGNVGSMLWQCGALLEVTHDEGFRGASVVKEPEPGELPANCCAKQVKPPRLEVVR
jgi:hypothetical protein